MKKHLLFLLFGLFSLITSAQISVSYTISPQADRKVISPYVYGSNYSQNTNFTTGENFTITRIGGNRTTAYNWENNASNAGSDWNFSSDNFMCSYLGIPDANSAIPGIAYTTIIDSARKHNAKTLATLQMAGYASRDKKGALTTVAPSARWCQVIPKKGSTFVLTPDTTDDKVYMDEFVNFLVNKYGLASAGGVKAYSLDNEPDLWAFTHKYAHPDTTMCQELIDRTVALSSAVKAVDNSAEIYGLVSYGMYGFLAFQGAPDWNSVKGSYSWFVDYFLDKTRAASATAGKRLVDVLDLHWYPEAQGDNRITSSSANTINDKLARLQAPRTLWDPDYTEKSWIGQWLKSYLPLIPKVQTSIDTYNPGTKLAFTEFDYGGGNDITGGIAMTDVLGIFGKYGVYASNYWSGSDPIPFLRLAYKMFRNYDGNNSAFGDMNIGAVMTDKENSSIYASVSQTSDDTMHVIVINKNMTQSISGSFDMNNTLNNYTKASVYAFTSTSTSIQKLSEITLTGNKFTYTLPALSVYHFVLIKNGTVTPVAVTGVALDSEALPLNFGSTAILTASVIPANATNRTVSWSSSNTAVATVSVSGLLSATVTGKGAGTATITVTTEDGTKTDVCNITVSGGGSCTFDTPLSSGLPGINKSFTYAYILGSGGPNLSNMNRLVVNWDLTNKSLNEFSMSTTNGQPDYYVDLRSGATQTFASSNPSITLSGTGFAGLDGNYFVSNYNGDLVMVNKTVNFSIYFSNSETPPACGSTDIPVTEVTMSPASLSLYLGNPCEDNSIGTLMATIIPSNATNKNVTWTTSNSSVAIVDNTGVVTAAGEGSAIISVTTEDGNNIATCDVNVSIVIPDTEVFVSPTTVTINAGSSTQLTAAVIPSCYSQEVTWSSNNTAVAKVSSKGLVSGVAPGSAIITATTVDGGITGTCSVNVEEPNTVTGVTVSPETATINIDATTQLTATVIPSNATNKDVTWSSSDTSVAKVSLSGLVTGVSLGTADITVTTIDGGFTAICTVIVEDNPTPCNFGIPLSVALPTINGSYNKVHVLSTGGPSLSNVTNFTINWDLSQNGLWQLSFNTNNGVPTWWLDLRTVATWKFNQAQPEITFANSGFSGLDGSYWVGLDGSNFVMVSKTGGYTVYFSNSSTAPSCSASESVTADLGNYKANTNAIDLYPNPVYDGKITVKLSIAEPSDVSITLFNQMGQTVLNKSFGKYNAGVHAIQMETPTSSGLYIFEIKAGDFVKRVKVRVQ